MAFSYHSKTSCLAFVNIYKYSSFLCVTDTWIVGQTGGWGRFQPYIVPFLHCREGCFSGCFFIQLKPAFPSSSQCKTGLATQLSATFICVCIEIFPGYCQGKPNASLDL